MSPEDYSATRQILKRLGPPEEEVTCEVVLGEKTRAGAKKQFQQQEQCVQGFGLECEHSCNTMKSTVTGTEGASLGVVRDGARE